MTTAQEDSISAGLDVRYLVAGSVLEFSEIDNQFLGKIPQVSINVRLVDCQSKKTVWSGSANASGNDHEIVLGIGAVRSREKLARLVVDKAVNSIAEMIGK